MRINKEYMDVMRRGRWIDKFTYEKQQFSGKIVAYSIIICAVMLIAFSCNLAHSEEISDDVAIQCILGEARGEFSKYGYNSFLAIAEVLRNRGSTQGIYGCSVDLSKENESLKQLGLFVEASLAWQESKISFLTKGATNFESTDFPEPKWAKNMVVTYQIGKHRFYK